MKEKNKDRTLVLTMLKEAKPVIGLFFVSLIIILILTYASALRPQITSNVITLYLEGFIKETIAYNAALEGIKRLSLIFLGLIILEYVLSFAKSYLLNLAGKKVIFNLRQKIYVHIQKLPLSFFDKTPVGAIVTRITNDSAALNDLFNSVLVGFIQNIVYIIIILVMMFNEDVSLSLISIVLVPLIAISTILFRKMARRIFRKIRAKISELNIFLSENITGMKIIQIFNMKAKKIKEFDKLNKDFYKANMDRIILFGVFRPLMDVIKYLTLAILFWFGGLKYIEGGLEIGTIYLFTYYIGEFFHPIMNLADQFNTIQSSMAAAEKIYDILEIENEVNPQKPTLLRNVKGEIIFENVWFSYVDDDWVLKDVSFTIKAGQNIAFVGHTGSGKTTIINLLCGFYEIQKGKITIDGIDIKDINKSEYRKHIGLVLQDVYLTSGNVYSNIKMNDESISNKKVEDIVANLQLDSFIEDFSDGFNHLINQGGTTLSSGQRQLISFARALIYDPQILVMDEATSNIDTETEIILQNSLDKLMKNRTTISIAHRLSTIQKADNIIVMHHGKIEEMGNHQKLLEQRGLYYKLNELQYKN